MRLLAETRIAKYRTLFLLIVATVIIGVYIVPSVCSYIEYQPEEGDIIFQSLPDSDLTRAIEGVTDSVYSHTGVVLNKNGYWYVREAIGPVKDTILYFWIMRGRKTKFSVFRLVGKYKSDIPAFIMATEKYLGLPYDIQYKLDDERIYCSELIYKAFKDATNEEMGRLDLLADLKWQAYKGFIESISINGAPLDRRIITPKGLAEADQLRKVYSNGI